MGASERLFERIAAIDAAPSRPMFPPPVRHMLQDIAARL
jgi:hypothetical protein